MDFVLRLPWLSDWVVRLHSADEDVAPPPSLPCLTVVNTGYSSGPGEHYVSYAVAGSDPAPASVTYFDSFGVPPYDRLLEHWRRCGWRTVRYSERCLQDPGSDACALYQMTFAAFAGVDYGFRPFLALFDPRDTALNDRLVAEFVLHVDETYL